MKKITKILAVAVLAAVTACALTACGGPKMTGYLLDGERKLAEGENTTIAVTGDYGDQVVEDSEKEAITIEDLTWKSSNEEVATVENGVVTAVSAGDTAISATSANGKLTGSMDITVVAVKSITVTVDKTELTLKEKETAPLTVTAVPERDDYKVIWESSDRKVATVDENGTVTAVAAGKAEIAVTVTKDDVTAMAKAEITVEAVPTPTPAPTAKPAKNSKPASNKPSKPAPENKPAPAPEQPAPAPAQPAPEQPAPAPAPVPEQPAPEATLPPNQEPFVSLPMWVPKKTSV